jgi:hypothetical protein
VPYDARVVTVGVQLEHRFDDVLDCLLLLDDFREVAQDNPEVGCGVAALPADVSRSGSRARAAYGRQVRRYIDRLVGLIRRPGADAKRDEVVMMLSALVGALSMARAVEDPELSDEILAGTARALHRRIGEDAAGG